MSPAIHKSEPEFVSRQVTEARRYYLTLTPSRKRKLEVVCGGVERCHPDYVVERSTFPFYAIEFVAEGAGQLFLNRKEYVLRPGMAFAYGPGVRHRIVNDPAKPMFKYYVDFTGLDARRLLQNSGLDAGKIVQVSATQEVRELFELLQKNGANRTAHSPKTCALLVQMLALKLEEKAIQYFPKESSSLPLYQKARTYIEENFLQLKSTEQIARECHLSPEYLCRLFKRFGQQSPYEVLGQYKMNRAAELLLEPGALVKQVSAQLHFSDPYHFSRVFKKAYGLSPQSFQKQEHSSDLR